MKYLLLTAFFGFFAFGQIKLNTEKSTIKITGTSSLHDWEMTVDKYDATGIITEEKVENLKVSVVTKSMKSGKSVMDKKAHEALQADKYPTIQFTAKSLTVNGDKISGKGNLTIAENSRPVDFTAKITSNTSNEMRLQGAFPLKMTSYNIDPPSAMFGTLKTGDEVVLVYDIFIIK